MDHKTGLLSKMGFFLGDEKNNSTDKKRHKSKYMRSVIPTFHLMKCVCNDLNFISKIHLWCVIDWFFPSLWITILVDCTSVCNIVDRIWWALLNYAIYKQQNNRNVRHMHLWTTSTEMNGWVFDECALPMCYIKYAGIRWLLVSSIFDTSPKKLLCIALPNLRSKRIDIPGTFVHRVQMHIKCFGIRQTISDQWLKWDHSKCNFIPSNIKDAFRHSDVWACCRRVLRFFMLAGKQPFENIRCEWKRLRFHWAIIFGRNGQFYLI